MAAAEVLATGTSKASSTDQEITGATTIGLKDVAYGCIVDIELKDDDAGYNRVDQLSSDKRAVVITGPGTYRFTRHAGAACGVYSG